MSLELGYVSGERCNRDNCEGVIEEREKEGSCSCHINPPCGYCTDDPYFCPACDWQGIDEQRKGYGSASAGEIAGYKKANEEWQEQRDSFYSKYNSGKGIEKLEMRTESHTHFTQKVVGVFPKGTETRESLFPKVKGSFGGRFTRFDEQRFEYIAYTD